LPGRGRDTSRLNQALVHPATVQEVPALRDGSTFRQGNKLHLPAVVNFNNICVAALFAEPEMMKCFFDDERKDLSIPQVVQGVVAFGVDTFGNHFASRCFVADAAVVQLKLQKEFFPGKKGIPTFIKQMQATRK
jgi:hypothetical protein